MTNLDLYLIIIHILNLLFYTFIWFNPQQFIKISEYFGYLPYKLMYNISYVFYILTIIPFIINYIIPNFNQIFNKLFSYGILLIIIGQFLNIYVYNKLGINGVYYGSKLGEKIIWIDDYIFNYIKHPQYIGCIMTVLGISLLINDYNCYLVCSSYIIGYLYMMTIEEFF